LSVPGPSAIVPLGLNIWCFAPDLMDLRRPLLHRAMAFNLLQTLSPPFERVKGARHD
jgi:hypothetical protein